MATSRCSRPAATRHPGRVAAIVLLAAAGASAPAHLSAQDPPDSAVVELRFFDVGQGDAVLIRAPDGRAVLYDGGDDGARLLAHLEAAGVTSLELVIASHNHADHIGGLAAAIERYRPRYVIENGLPHTTRAYERFLRAIIAAGSERLAPTRRVIALDSVRLTVLPPPEAGPGGQNGRSVGLRIDYVGFSATLLGDSEQAQQRWWLAHHDDVLGPVAVHKASHHGSRNGDTRVVMERLKPAVVVIGVGARNRYGHPDPRILALYRDVGSEVARTDLHGTVTVLGERDGSYRLQPQWALATTGPRPAPGESHRGDPATPCVDLNRADARALEAIIHIGPERARQIVALRARRPFGSVAEITRVRGIADARARDIARQGLVCVGGR